MHTDQSQRDLQAAAMFPLHKFLRDLNRIYSLIMLSLLMKSDTRHTFVKGTSSTFSSKSSAKMRKHKLRSTKNKTTERFYNELAGAHSSLLTLPSDNCSTVSILLTNTQRLINTFCNLLIQQFVAI